MWTRQLSVRRRGGIASGIDDIIIITGRGKRTIEDYFDFSPQLENHLAQSDKQQQLEQMRAISALADIHYIRQTEPKGLGDAVLKAEKHIGAEPFAVLLGDDIIRSNVPCLKQFNNRFTTYESPMIAIENVVPERISSYGIIKGRRVTDSLYLLTDVVEKPLLNEAPSRLGVVGRYVVTPDLFGCIRQVSADATGEVQLTDATRLLLGEHEVYAYLIEGTR